MRELEKLSLKLYRDQPELLSKLSVEELAWLAHEAELEEDDVTQMHIDSLDSLLVMGDETETFLSAYRATWTKHAKFRGYHARA